MSIDPRRRLLLIKTGHSSPRKFLDHQYQLGFKTTKTSKIHRLPDLLLHKMGEHAPLLHHPVSHKFPTSFFSENFCNPKSHIFNSILRHRTSLFGFRRKTHNHLSGWGTLMAGWAMSRIKFLLMNIFLFIKQQTTFIIKTLKLLLIRPNEGFSIEWEL